MCVAYLAQINAVYLRQHLRSAFINIGIAVHINVSSGNTELKQGLEILKIPA
jgi:predicted alpha/beta hydrolase family esterase